MATKENRVKYETLKKNWKEEMDMKHEAWEWNVM